MGVARHLQKTPESAPGFRELGVEEATKQWLNSLLYVFAICHSIFAPDAFLRVPLCSSFSVVSSEKGGFP